MDPVAIKEAKSLSPKSLSLVTYNIHKGFGLGRLRFLLPQMRHALSGLQPDFMLLQEVQGFYRQRSKRIQPAPVRTQFEYMAEHDWPHFIYAKNAIYPSGHHGNAILSKHTFDKFENFNLSKHRRASRSILHGQIKIAEGLNLHLLCVHLALFKAERHAQCKAIIQKIRQVIPEHEPLLMAGDFNDWRKELSRPLAEEMGIISALGEFVLDQSCIQIKKWAEIGFDHLTVSVNVSAQQLQRGNFLAMLDRVLKKHQIDPHRLELEITETLLMDETEKVRTILNEIRNRHVTIALDDFGTGYSSLSYLSLYPIDVIKIDRSFVLQMITNPEQKAIVRAILAMSHSLNMQVVAEGVETIEQAQFLRDEGCHLLQGYLFSKPIPAADATLLLIKSKGQPLISM